MATNQEIRAARASLHETQAEFAERFHVDQGTVSRWENTGPPSRGLVLIEIERFLESLKRGAAA